ncbi:TRAP transporter substrate-binding protein [Saccharospirillum alexandrii]|uniref:TRAP transporter substrate-binding protein n=1 Tax=Saccharospirillum alexandrii TaxID=2448477 RepID=UPI000FD84156|nr:TRAP transporter substrate-binding protein [Saccharospirillum alexandrii]
MKDSNHRFAVKPVKRLPLICLVVTSLVSLVSTAQAEEFQFRLHHFLGPDSPAQKVLLEPWAERIREQSNGRIDISIHPAMSLGGAPPTLLNQVESGEVDMVWTLAGYTPGRFPRTEVFELPAVHFRSAYATNRAIFANFDLIEADYRGVKPLLVHVHAGNAIQMANQNVTDPSDLRGLTIRTPSRTGGWLIDAWQAEQAAMPAPRIRDALADGSIDGALIPFEVFSSIGLEGLVGHSTIGSDGSRFGTSVFLFLMNQSQFDALPADLQQVIDDNIGIDFVKEMGLAWDDLEVPGRMVQYENLTKLPVDEIYAFEDLSEQVVQRWIEDVSAQGIDGRQLVDEARRYIARYSRIITTLE